MFQDLDVFMPEILDKQNLKYKILVTTATIPWKVIRNTPQAPKADSPSHTGRTLRPLWCSERRRAETRDRLDRPGRSC
jgi:hypothetical protein